MLKTVLGVKCIFAVGGLGFVDGVNRYFIYKAITCRRVEVVVLQNFNLAEHLSGSQTQIASVVVLKHKGP